MNNTKIKQKSEENTGIKIRSQGGKIYSVENVTIENDNNEAKKRKCVGALIIFLKHAKCLDQQK